MSRRFFASVVVASLALQGDTWELRRACRPLRAQQHSAKLAARTAARPAGTHHGDVDGKERAFWFMRYTVINNANKDVLFTPSFELLPKPAR